MLSACRSNSMSTPVPSLQREEGRGGGREGGRRMLYAHACTCIHTHTRTHTHTCNQLWVAMERCMLNKHIVSEIMQLTFLPSSDATECTRTCCYSSNYLNPTVGGGCVMDRVLSTMHALHHNVEMHTAAYTGHSKHAVQCGPRKVGDIVNNPHKVIFVLMKEHHSTLTIVCCFITGWVPLTNEYY